MAIRYLNNVIPKKEDWRDLFTFPDDSTLRIWTNLRDIDLITIASMDDSIKDCVFAYRPHLKTMTKILNLSSFEIQLSAAQLNAVFTVYKSLDKIIIPSSLNCCSTLLKSIAHVKDPKELYIFVRSTYEFEKSSLTLDQLDLVCNFQTLHTKKDPIMDILCSLNDVQTLRITHGLLSRPSIALFKRFWYKELVFNKTSVSYVDSKFFAETFLKCELYRLRTLKFILNQNCSAARGFFVAQSIILKGLHRCNIDLHELTFTAADEKLNLRNLHRIRTLQKVTIYLNIWCRGNVFRSLLPLISRLQETKVQISVVEYDQLDGFDYLNRPNEILMNRQAIRDINPNIQIVEYTEI